LFGSAYASGWAVSYFEWAAPIHLLVTGWIVAPIFLRNRLTTTTEYLEKRYAPRVRATVCVATLFMYLVNRLAVSVYSGATVLHTLFGWSVPACSIGLVALTAVYTAAGGLGAVIITDVAQALVLLFGTAVMLGIGIDRVGGLDTLFHVPPNGTTYEDWEKFFHMYRPPEDKDFPTLGLLLGFNASALWYWCLDQAIVQRVLAASSVQHARAACNFAGFLKLLVVFLIVLPGVIARHYFSDALLDSPNEVLPVMMKQLLPPGVLGILLAAMIAACMSSLDSIFTAAGSLVCLDLYRPLRPSASEQELVTVGRVLCLVLAVLSLLWLPIIDLLSDQIFVYLNSIQMCFTPPVVTVYFGGMLWRRATTQGAMATLAVGYALGLYRFIGEVLSKVDPPAPGSMHYWWVTTNVFHAGGIMWAICVVTLVVVSFLTPRPHQSQLEGLVTKLNVRNYCFKTSTAPRFVEHTEIQLDANGPKTTTRSAPQPPASVPAGTEPQPPDIKSHTTASFRKHAHVVAYCSKRCCTAYRTNFVFSVILLVATPSLIAAWM